MTDTRQQFAEATRADEASSAAPQHRTNPWKVAALVVAGSFVLTIGGCSLVVGLAAMGASSDGGGGKQNAPAQSQDVASDGQASESKEPLNGPAPKPDTKHVEVVLSSPDGPADYSIYDDKFKVSDSQQIQGTQTFEYDLPQNDGLMVDLMTDGMHGYVAIEVYEDGKLVAQDEDPKWGMADVSY